MKTPPTAKPYNHPDIVFGMRMLDLAGHLLFVVESLVHPELASRPVPYFHIIKSTELEPAARYHGGPRYELVAERVGHKLYVANCSDEMRDHPLFKTAVSLMLMPVTIDAENRSCAFVLTPCEMV